MGIRDARPWNWRGSFMQMHAPRTRTPGVSVLGVTLRTLRNINDLRATKTEHYKKYGTLFVFKDLALVTLVTLHHLLVHYS